MRAVLVDTQGPEIRTGLIEGGGKIALMQGSTIELTTNPVRPGERNALCSNALCSICRAVLCMALCCALHGFGVFVVGWEFVSSLVGFVVSKASFCFIVCDGFPDISRFRIDEHATTIYFPYWTPEGRGRDRVEA